MAGLGVGEAMMLSAAMGGGSAAMRGEDPLKGAVIGGITGGIGSAVAPGISELLSGAPEAANLASAAPTNLASAAPSAMSPGAISTPINLGSVTSTPLANDYAQFADQLSAGSYAPPDISRTFTQAPVADSLAAEAALPGRFGSDASSLYGAPSQAAAKDASSLYGASSQAKAPEFGKVYSGTGQAPKQGLAEMWKGLSPEKKLLYGGAGGMGLMGLMSGRNRVPGQSPYDGPLSKFRFNPDAYRPFRAASGGIANSDIAVGADSMPAGYNRMASGGIASLGSYSDGGRLLKGPGDGMSDNIPATISNKRPARLADGEFVVPADVVSHLGNGSTDAGAKQLYAMMNKVRKARTGNSKQGKQISPQKFMPS